MNTAKKRGFVSEKLITTGGLMEMLGCSRTSAVRTGTRADAQMQIGHRIYWNVDKVNEWLDSVQPVNGEVSNCTQMAMLEENNMNETLKSHVNENRKTVDTVELQAMLGTGRKTAVEIGTAAGARIQIGRRVIWNVKKIERYLDSISE